MCKYIVAFVSVLFAFLGNLQAQEVLNTGLFVQQDASSEVDENYNFLNQDPKDISWNFQGYASGKKHNLSMSFKVGSFLFGFESLSSNTASISTNYAGENLAASSSAGFTGASNRALMGVMLPRNIALYGFQGFIPHSSSTSLSYYDETDVSGYHIINGRCVRIKNAYHISSGSSSAENNNFVHSMGGGMETVLLGGVFRVEYGFSILPGYKHTTKLENRTTDSRLPFSGSKDSVDFQWADNINQSVQFRWRKTF